jgi:hypothetical protein
MDPAATGVTQQKLRGHGKPQNERHRISLGK